jgi:hypothetical protein
VKKGELEVKPKRRAQLLRFGMRRFANYQKQPRQTRRPNFVQCKKQPLAMRVPMDASQIRRIQRAHRQADLTTRFQKSRIFSLDRMQIKSIMPSVIYGKLDTRTIE